MFYSLRKHWWKKEKCVLFTSKAHFVLKIIKFYFFRYSNIMVSSNTQAWKTKHILLNNLISKYSLVIKFGQFMLYYNIKFFIKKFHEKCGLETSSTSFLIFKKSSVKRILWRSSCWFGQILIALPLLV